MKSFIFDYTGKKAIRISHISIVEVVDGESYEQAAIVTEGQYNQKVIYHFRYKNVQCIVCGNTYTLAKGFSCEEFAIKWMRNLGFVKGKKEKDDPINL
jgi:hypothetical protein